MTQPSSDTETDVVRHRYDRGAGRYDLVTWPMERMAMDRFRGRLIAQVNGPRVLEVGVGTGRNLPLYPPDLQVDAIDFSRRMLERARRKPSCRKPSKFDLPLNYNEPVLRDQRVLHCSYCQ